MRSLVWTALSAIVLSIFAIGCSGGTQSAPQSGAKPPGSSGAAKLPDAGPPPPIIKK